MPEVEANDGYKHGCLDALTFALGSYLDYAQCLVDALVGSSQASIFRIPMMPDLVSPSLYSSSICGTFSWEGSQFFPLREFDDRSLLFLRVGEFFSETTYDTNYHMEVLPMFADGV